VKSFRLEKEEESEPAYDEHLQPVDDDADADTCTDLGLRLRFENNATQYAVSAPVGLTPSTHLQTTKYWVSCIHKD